MKKISILIPSYNEEANIRPLCDEVRNMFRDKLADYDYEIVIIDNKSKDETRSIVRQMCSEDSRIKAIFNAQNFGSTRSPYYGLCQTDGDCTILLCADFQDPIELIPLMVEEWEKGNKVVCMIKSSSKENHFIYLLRTLYYKAIRAMSEVKQIQHFTGFGLYDKSFIEILRRLDDPTPFLRGIVAEYAPDHLEIPYEQQKRRGGRSSNNFLSLYDAAMLSFTSYTKIGLRIMTLLGFAISAVSFIVALVYLILKLVYWDTFLMGSAPILIGMFLLNGIQLSFLGMLSEYVMSMNVRIIHRPLVIEEERINFNPVDTQKV